MDVVGIMEGWGMSKTVRVKLFERFFEMGDNFGAVTSVFTRKLLLRKNQFKFA